MLAIVTLLLMIRYNAVQEQNAFPPTVPHVSPPFVYTDKGGDSNAALTDLLLATSPANPQGRKTPYFHTAMHPSFGHLVEQTAGWLCPTPDPQNRAVLVNHHRH